MIKLSLILLFTGIFTIPVSAQIVRTLNGQVIDFDTHEPLKGSTIHIREPLRNVTTDDSGRFVLTLEPAEYSLIISYVGYNAKNFSVSLFTDQSIQFGIKKKGSTLLDEVIVNAEFRKNKVKETEMGIVRVNPEQLKRIPVAFGEPDILKALTLQPGVITAGEGAGGFYVRGGNADQNLVLLDGAPLFNTSHLLGFYTTVSPDVAQDITLYKGTIPAQFGGRLSSLLNINVKPGNSERTRYSGGISPVSGRFFAEGFAIKNKLTFAVGGRVAYPNLLLNLFPKNIKKSRAFFYDGLLKAQYMIAKDHAVSITLYRSLDRFKFDSTTAYAWRSNVASLNYTGILSSKWQLQLNGVYSGFDSDLEGLTKNYESVLSSFIHEKEAKMNLVYTLTPQIKINTGGSIVQYDILPSKESPDSDSSQVILRQVEKERGAELAGYINTDIELNKIFSIQAGVRYVVYQYRGEKSTYAYQAGVPMSKETITDTIRYRNGDLISQYSGVEPRISLKIALSPETSLKLGYHHGQQFLHLITNTNAISPVDFWKLSDSYLRPQTGDQYSAGIFRNLIGYDLSLEGYYKNLKNQVEYKNGAMLLLNPVIETALLPAEGYAYGTEVSVSKNTGKLTGQVNYGYSRSFTRVLTEFAIDRVNDGQYYPTNYDRPHNISILTKYKLRGGWSFHTNFIYTSGRPATYPDGNYSINNTIVTNYSQRNMDRLPAYHRLDISLSCVTRRYESQKKYSIWNFSVYNIYGRANTYSVFFRRESSALKAYRLSVIGAVIPSISWNYYF
ncbi:MAG TPA: TonB-dependent receptor [Flavitalea sp.]|nr:TonB-dependent receptor [Flavitalea sp.]